MGVEGVLDWRGGLDHGLERISVHTASTQQAIAVIISANLIEGINLPFKL